MPKRLLFVLSIGLSLLVLSFALIGFAFSSQAASSSVLISAVYYDTYLPNEPDESFRLTNVSANMVDLSNWTATDGEGVITLTGNLDAGHSLWIANKSQGVLPGLSSFDVSAASYSMRMFRIFFAYD